MKTPKGLIRNYLMKSHYKTFTISVLIMAISGLSLQGAHHLRNSLNEGTPDIQSTGPIAFGPEGILFIADPKGATIFAVDTKDQTASSGNQSPINIENIGMKTAAVLGTSKDRILIQDLAVNPISGNAYLSVSRGRGPEGKAVILKVGPKGKLSIMDTKSINFSKISLPNAPDPNAKGRRGRSPRQQSITDMAYLDGNLIVAGLSNEEFASTLRSIPFPFKTADKGSSIEIYHGAHGNFETRSPVRTFVPFDIKGKSHIMAAYTCTPLVKIPVEQLKPGKHVKGITVAELGNRNNPLDMIAYKKSDRNWLLMANTARGIMKITTDELSSAPGITDRGSGKKGVSYETIEDGKGIKQLDALGSSLALVLQETDSGSQHLVSLPLP